MTTRIFLLSPARLDGARARLLFNPDAAFPLAQAVRAREGASLADVFSFLSGLYFRGKHAYAQMFGRGSAGVAAVHIITTSRGLLSPDTRVTRHDLESFAQVDLSAGGELFRAPFVGRGDMSRGGVLLRSARAERELAYLPVAGAVRRGRRPPKLARAR